MLALSRGELESVRILVPPSKSPQEVKVTVVKSRDGLVRLSFDAPREITILRDELEKHRD